MSALLIYCGMAVLATNRLLQCLALPFGVLGVLAVFRCATSKSRIVWCLLLILCADLGFIMIITREFYLSRERQHVRQMIRDGMERDVCANYDPDRCHGDGMLLTLVGYCHLQIGDLVLAERCFRLALVPNPSDKSARFCLAAVCTKGNPAEAIHIYRELLTEEPMNGELHLRYAALMSKIGSFEEAKRHYEFAAQFLQHGPLRNRALFALQETSRRRE